MRPGFQGDIVMERFDRLMQYNKQRIQITEFDTIQPNLTERALD